MTRVSVSAALAAALALAGCASPQQLQQRAMNAPEFDVCYGMVLGNGYASQAVSSRGIDCRPYMPMIQARIEADRQQAQTGLMLLQASRPKPMPMPQPTVCRTVQVGGGWQTVCD